VTPRTTLRLLLVLALAALCWRTGGHALFEPDEGRNVEVAREMARGGDYVLPHLNGLPYLDKPAPYFAAVALSLRALGESEGAARFASLVFTFGSILIVFLLGRRIGPPLAAELSAVALATMPMVLAFSRTVIFDPALACIETATLYAAWRALERDAHSLRWAALLWGAIGIGAITKGPVALIVPMLVLAGFAVIAGTSLRPIFRLRAWPWFFVMGLPWFIAVTLRRPDFPRYAFIYESLQRVATQTHHRWGPVWYFIPVALVGSFPWAAPAIASLGDVWRRRVERREPAARAAAFLVAWALVPLVFFSISQSKLPGYYLPALPAWALAAGLLLAHAAQDDAAMRRTARAATVAGWLLLALAVTLLVAMRMDAVRRPLTGPERDALANLALGLGGALAAAGAFAIDGGRRRNLPMMAAAFALPTIALPIIGGPMLHAVGLQRSSIEMAAAIERAVPNAVVVGAGAYPTSLRYYLDRPVLLSTGAGSEMTSNYVASRLEEFRALPDSPLRPEGWWREALDACRVPTVFVARRRSAIDSALAGRLPLIATGGADAKFAAYGPCSPPAAGSSVPR
jgi:4-amino-4-deoxy-L-arabinose transferase-like glycosyltransferase